MRKRLGGTEVSQRLLRFPQRATLDLNEAGIRQLGQSIVGALRQSRSQR